MLTNYNGSHIIKLCLGVVEIEGEIDGLTLNTIQLTDWEKNNKK